MPFTIGIVAGATLSQQLIRRVGTRNVATIGMIGAAAGLVYLTQLTTHSTYFGGLFPTIAVMSIGMGMSFVPLTLLATTNVDEGDAGLASGLFNTSQQIGGALGLAILSTLATSRMTHLLHGGAAQNSALTRGYHVAFAVGAAMMIAGIIVLWGVTRSKDIEQISVGEPAVPA